MPQNPLNQMFGLQGAQTLRNNGSLSSLRQQTEEDILGSTDAGGNHDPFAAMLYHRGEQEAAQDDPWAEHYRNVGEAQSEADIYNLPEVEDIRDDERSFQLEKATAPARMQGEYAVQAANAKGAAQYDALQGMLGAGLKPGQSVSVSGVGSMREGAQPRPQRAPASVTNRLLDAQKATQPSGIRGFFGVGPSESSTANLSNVVQEVARLEGIHPNLIMDVLTTIQSNPNSAPEDVLRALEGDDLTDGEREQILSIATRLR